MCLPERSTAGDPLSPNRADTFITYRIYNEQGELLDTFELGRFALSASDSDDHWLRRSGLGIAHASGDYSWVEVAPYAQSGSRASTTCF